MYRLDTPLIEVKGIGQVLAHKLATKNMTTVQDLLLWVPSRYEDRSHQVKINQLQVGKLVTINAQVVSFSNQYKGRRSIQRAIIEDESGRLNLIWFNQPFLKESLTTGQTYFFSGQLNERGMMAQPQVETVSADTIHTNRLIPIYPAIADIKTGRLRRLLKTILDHLVPLDDSVLTKFDLLSLDNTFRHLHFPDQAELTIQARRRLALEELLGLMTRSQHIKQQWQQQRGAHRIETGQKKIDRSSLPFELTIAQQKSLHQILLDINSDVPMNRLLIGDVGAGKTVVAALAAQQVLAAGHQAALIAPTQILAKQHLQTLNHLFPKMATKLIVGANSNSNSSPTSSVDQPTLYIGTHAILNRLSQLKPALIIYDEQHRFGVSQRSEAHQLTYQPHILTMSATPIPRSLMLTIFSHLELSVIDELPQGRQPTKTWLTPNKKRADAYRWIKEEFAAARQTKQPYQLLWICPFINHSSHPEFDQVAAAADRYQQLTADFPELSVALLHGQQSAADQNKTIRRLFDQKIDLLVTTPIVEVGVDLPAASIMVIESAERFGLASLHQLRGRVGRAGQQGFCLLFTSTQSRTAHQRLKTFTQVHQGMKLAEFDLQNRGGGDLFGTEQHGFDQLRFANWTNLELIAQARRIFNSIQNQKIQDWQPLITPASAPMTELAAN